MNELAPQAARTVSAAAESETQRAIAEVQAQMLIAQKFPRDVEAAQSSIIQECMRPALAEMAIYEYARGGNAITGASIRLIEMIALEWGNISSGWRELDRRMVNGVMYAELEAYAWDMQRNKRQSITFKAKLARDTRKGSYPLKDERDVYEHCANMAARRVRSCLEAVIPGYVKEQAVEQCRRTLKESVNTETTKKMIAAFEDSYGVTKEQIELQIQRDIEAITPAQVVRLRQIFTSLKDGMGRAEDFFPAVEPEQPVVEEKKSGTAALKDQLAKKSEEKKPEEPSSTNSEESQKSDTEATPMQESISTTETSGFEPAPAPEYEAEPAQDTIPGSLKDQA